MSSLINRKNVTDVVASVRWHTKTPVDLLKTSRTFLVASFFVKKVSLSHSWHSVWQNEAFFSYLHGVRWWLSPLKKEDSSLLSSNTLRCLFLGTASKYSNHLNMFHVWVPCKKYATYYRCSYLFQPTELCTITAGDGTYQKGEKTRLYTLHCVYVFFRFFFSLKYGCHISKSYF